MIDAFRFFFLSFFAFVSFPSLHTSKLLSTIRTLSVTPSRLAGGSPKESMGNKTRCFWRVSFLLSFCFLLSFVPFYLTSYWFTVLAAPAARNSTLTLHSQGYKATLLGANLLTTVVILGVHFHDMHASFFAYQLCCPAQLISRPYFIQFCIL